MVVIVFLRDQRRLNAISGYVSPSIQTIKLERLERVTVFEKSVRECRIPRRTCAGEVQHRSRLSVSRLSKSFEGW